MINRFELNLFPHTTILQQTTLNIFCKKIENLYNWMDNLKVENIVAKEEVVLRKRVKAVFSICLTISRRSFMFTSKYILRSISCYHLSVVVVERLPWVWEVTCLIPGRVIPNTLKMVVIAALCQWVIMLAPPPLTPRRAVISTIFKVFGMTQLGIEPKTSRRCSSTT